MLAPVVNVLLAVLAVSLLILVHELGHFAAAKAIGLRVEVFSIGFWKKIVGFRWGQTQYQLCVIPLGGYVKVGGESAKEGGAGAEDEYWSKTPGQRALFIVGGVAMNFVLALVLFIAAFAIGVPFVVAEVGQTDPGWPAWQAGLRAGDRIVQIDDVQDPVFPDVTAAVALGGQKRVELHVLRDGKPLVFVMQPRYEPISGVRQIGIAPVLTTKVTGLAHVGDENGPCPAEEAGIELGDTIVAVNGRTISTSEDLANALANYPQNEVELTVDRAGQTLTMKARTVAVPQYVIGISGQSATVKDLERDGPAQLLGLKVGDRITAVNGHPTASWAEVSDLMRSSLGPTTLTVARGAEDLTFHTDIPDAEALDRFAFSVLFESSTEITWVREGGPAWKLGLRPGDSIVSVGGEKVSDWIGVVTEGARSEGKPYQIAWEREAKLYEAQAQPEADTSFSRGVLGVVMGRPKMEEKHYGVVQAVQKGFVNTGRSIMQIFGTLRGFVTRQVSTRQMGGIVMIAYVSYHAAQEGIGTLLHLTAVLSAMLAFLNVLPIPVLDGGHLLFLAIEKVRGRRVGDQAMGIAQTVGLVLLLLLVAYALRNDISHLFLAR